MRLLLFALTGSVAYALLALFIAGVIAFGLLGLYVMINVAAIIL